MFINIFFFANLTINETPYFSKTHLAIIYYYFSIENENLLSRGLAALFIGEIVINSNSDNTSIIHNHFRRHENNRNQTMTFRQYHKFVIIHRVGQYYRFRRDYELLL